MKFEYSEIWERQIMETKEQIEQIEQIEYIEDKLRSQNIAKQYRRYLQQIGQL